MRKTAVLLCLALFLLAAPPAEGDAQRTTYVPLLDRRVPQSALDMQVYATDISFEDWAVPSARHESDLRGENMKVCVVDTGVDPAHEQIAPRTVRMYDAIDAHAEVPAYDPHGHGTHVASIAAGDGKGSEVAGRFRGVAPRARILAARVLNAEGSGTFEQVIEGLTWCAERPKVDVITMSLGTRAPSDGAYFCCGYGEDILSPVVDAIVRDYGKVVTVAAGNNRDATGSIGSPGAAAEAITVGAAAEWSSTWPPEDNPEFSSGPYLAPFSSRGGGTLTPKPDIVAPGTTVMAATAGTVSGYHAWSGTSMATPFVAGTALLLIQQRPELTPAEVKAALQGTAFDLGPVGHDVDYGYGFIDVRAALGLSPTAFPPHETLSGHVDRGQKWVYDFTVTDPSEPITVTVIENGGALWGGGGTVPDPENPWADPWTWEPPICVTLSYPDGTALRYACKGDYVDTFASLFGRQVTVGWNTPGHPPVEGTYRVEVYIGGDESYPIPLMDQASFTVDIFYGAP
jgi:serine protease AprX